MKFKRFVRIAEVYRVVTFILVLFVSHAAVHGEVRVRLTINDGRVIEGEVDARTNNESVWVRVTEPGIALSFPIRWSTLDEVELGKKSISVSEFRGLAHEIKTKLSKKFFATIAPVEELSVHPDPEPVFIPVQPEVQSKFHGSRVHSLRIEAVLTNWDEDVEPDGLDVYIIPLDGRYNLVPVRGTVTMRLIGERSHGPRRERVYQNLEHWNVSTLPGDYGQQGAVYRFPFQTVFPEIEPELFPFGFLHVRLGAQGHGNFEASLPVKLKNINPIRDRLELDHGQRFFPNELAQESHPVYAVSPGARDTR